MVIPVVVNSLGLVNSARLKQGNFTLDAGGFYAWWSERLLPATVARRGNPALAMVASPEMGNYDRF